MFESPEVVFKLRKRYGVYEAKVYERLIAMIGEVPEVEGKGRLKTEVLISFLDKIYKRTK